MEKKTLNRIGIKRKLLFIPLFILLSYGRSFSQALPYAVMLARTDSPTVSGSFINSTGSGLPIYYNIHHNTVTHTVDVQITALDSVLFNFDILDTTYHRITTTGGINHGTYNTTVNVSPLNASLGYLLFRFNTDVPSSTYLFYTTFK